MTSLRGVDATLPGRAPGYLPGGWVSQTDGAGHAMLALLGHLAGLVDEGVQRAPQKAALSFLDFTGASLLAPTPARAPLVFTLVGDAPSDTPLAAGSQVAAVLPAPLPQLASSAGGVTSEPIVFATERDISVARASLAAVCSVNPAADKYADHGTGAPQGFTVFDTRALIPHHLYLGHDSLFDLNGPATVGIEIAVSHPEKQGQLTAVSLAWEYLTAGGWLAFEPVVDQTHGLTNSGEVLLRKSCGPPTARGVVDGVEAFWIRARVDEALPPPGKPSQAPLPAIDSLRAWVSVTEERLLPDVAFHDGVLLDTTKDFYPLGTEPTLGTSLLLACDTAFKRAGARVGVRIVSSVDNNDLGSHTPTLTWEYSLDDGGWKEFLQGNGEQFTNADPHTVTFARPRDWAQASIAGQRHYWLRIRLSAGGYGRLRHAAGTVVESPAPPILTQLTVSYAYDTERMKLDQVRTLNLFTFADQTEGARWGRAAFQAFTPLAEREPSWYLGFDQALPPGLVSLLAANNRVDSAGSTSPPSPFTWEYSTRAGWAELSVRDETGGGWQTGLIQFVAQPDHAPLAGPDGRLWWVRARYKTPTATPEQFVLDGLYLNAVWASRRTPVTRENAGIGDGSRGQLVDLSHPSILPGQMIEIQEWRGSGREWESLFRDVAPPLLRLERDNAGVVTGVWVRWLEQPHLYSSGPKERHYTLDRVPGRLGFGDGEFGLRLPPGAAIAASYDYGGGQDGNVPPGTLTQLHSAVPYIATVSNPTAASGGAASEQVAATCSTGPPLGVEARGAQRVRHRDRAVAASDYEWLARDASAQVALAHCHEATGEAGGGMPGCVTVAIVPWSDIREPHPDAELLRRVHGHLRTRVPAAIAGNVRVIGPSYQPIGVVADVVVDPLYPLTQLEESLRDSIDTFLHPLRGGRQRSGWPFGATIRMSHVATLMTRLPGIGAVTALQLSSLGTVFSDAVSVGADHLPTPGQHLLRLELGV